MQFEEAFAGVEDAPEAAADTARGGLDGPFGHEVEVEFGAQGEEPVAEGADPFAAVPGCGGGVGGLVEEAADDAEVVAGARGEPVADDDGLEAGVDEGGDDRVLEAGGDDDLVGELVVGAAQPAQFGAQRLLLGGVQVADDEDLEVRGGGRGRGVRGVRRLVGRGARGGGGVRGGAVVAVSGEGAVQLVGALGELPVLVPVVEPAELLQRGRAGEGPAVLDGCQEADEFPDARGGVRAAVRTLGGEAVGEVRQ
ncbi:hypothetical protein ABTX77_34775 [Streptomyces sp. NPDC097704]|uniref:hypothetical protein n=1 Tax=Streptomyces sp. NPDC097704 TaxID=3157101 RepID=UPI0033215565